MGDAGAYVWFALTLQCVSVHLSVRCFMARLNTRGESTAANYVPTLARHRGNEVKAELRHLLWRRLRVRHAEVIPDVMFRCFRILFFLFLFFFFIWTETGT
ncbi:hypothetical protein DQ04_05961020 [Trypanosoma grayi]|uniref:hypothetical protein n=1 Tax=Trypanosoma grayi TaxID=71804 RepID=UPI0004F4B1CE|nr:hypothetical protein DQ04_05961020 [Trypanosoma grayi]KEG09027.1 hypothetical protein DQ04_05961020 [Trypanosoma grayi]